MILFFDEVGESKPVQPEMSGVYLRNKFLRDLLFPCLSHSTLKEICLMQITSYLLSQFFPLLFPPQYINRILRQ